MKDKLAIIRSDTNNSCPFGLPIINACSNVGKAIFKMKAIDDKDDNKTLNHNNLVYFYDKTGAPCPFAENILINNNKVNCDFNDTGAGIKMPTIDGSPLYPKIFTDELYNNQQGYYGDNDTARNLFLGLYSLLGEKTINGLIKLGKNYLIQNRKTEATILSIILNGLFKIVDNG